MVVPLADLPVIGAMSPMDGKAPLAIVQPVHRLPDGRVLIAVRFPTEASVEGDVADDGEWAELVECDEACELPEPVTPGLPVSVWILRPHGPPGWRGLALQALDRRGAHATRWSPWMGGAIVCLARTDRQDAALAALADDFDSRVAWTRARQGQSFALPWAELAMLASPKPTPDRWGRMIGLVRRVRGDEEADSYAAFARNSWGAAFVEAARRVADEVAR